MVDVCDHLQLEEVGTGAGLLELPVDAGDDDTVVTEDVPFHELSSVPVAKLRWNHQREIYYPDIYIYI